MSFTLHLITDQFRMRTFSLGALPLYDMPHTGKDIAECWRDIESQLNLPEQFRPVITTDGASNIRNAACRQSLTEEFFWIWCCCHVIHLAVEAGHKVIARETQFVQKVKGFVTHMHQSPKQWENFKRHQLKHIVHSKHVRDRALAEADGVEVTDEAVPVQLLYKGVNSTSRSATSQVPQLTRVLALLQQVDNRWASMYAMLVRFQQLRGPITTYHEEVMSDGDQELKDKLANLELSIVEWNNLDAIVKVMKTMVENQRLLEASDHPNITVAGTMGGFFEDLLAY